MNKLLFLLLFLAPITSAINTDDYGMSIGVVETDYKSGSNALAYYSRDIENINLRWNVIDLNMFSRDSDGYRTEILSNGNEVCRHEETGEFSDKANCSGIDFDFATSIEVSYFLVSEKYPLSFNVGARILGDKEFGGRTHLYTGVRLYNSEKSFYSDIRFSSKYALISFGMSFTQLMN
ncbi:MAG: hypothetical protein JXR16_12550 [Bermanella sp.]